MAHILIIDDEEMICDSLSRIFQDMGHDVFYSLTLKEGIAAAKSKDFDVVFLDVRLPDGNGIEELPMVQATESKPEVIIITGYADPDSAELAIRSNAWDYIRKPASIDAVTLSLNRALQYRSEKKASRSAVTLKRIKREGIIGNSPGIINCLDIVAKAAVSNTNILITGETGTGKELFARAVHANSARSQENFVPVDCASLPKTLIENTLFGHAKGSFTGADKAEDGLIRTADRGTLFLDEIGELPMTTQKTFLRVLQERRFRPIGGVQEIKSDFRLVSASNRNLEEMAKSGRFRNDLLFRLRSVTIHLPPLRERLEDIKEIAVNYMMKLCESDCIGMKGFSSDFFDVMMSYNWPGNVRELYGVLEWVIVQAFNEPTIFPKHLPPRIRIQMARSSFENEKTQPEQLNGNEATENSFKNFPNWKDFRKKYIAEGEKRYLSDLMAETRGNIKQASDLSGLSPPRLYELLRKYKISTK
ncbi:MAG: Fis family transcriptional regulator [Desulfobacteraceae bacterium IS3]|nr:MAG: Fis family transcriptional regulator [Desulfobacteraceae bacterium IS3]